MSLCSFLFIRELSMIFRVSKGVNSFFDRVYKNTTMVFQRDELLNSFQLIPSSAKYSPEGLRIFQ